MRSDLYDATIRNQVMVEGLKAEEVRKFGPVLKEIDRSIRERLSGDELTEFSRTRLERLLGEVDKLLLGLLNGFADQLDVDLVDIALYEAEFEAASLQAAAKAVPRGNVLVTFEPALPGIEAVKAAILTTPLSVRGADGGKLLKSFIAGWTQAERSKVVGAIRQGYFEGQTNAEIVRAIRGTRALRYKDGILATTERNASTVVRTAVQHVATQGRMATLSANSDVVTSVEWVSTLDSRTTQQCKSLDGKRFAIDKGPRPPIHPNCRSSIVPVTRLTELFSEGATRAAKGDSGPGQVSAGLSYYEWLKGQPAAFQDQALGKARAKLFRDGGLSAERFSELNLDRNFMPLTLDEMRRLEPLAFERAGL